MDWAKYFLRQGQDLQKKLEELPQAGADFAETILAGFVVVVCLYMGCAAVAILVAASFE